MKRLIKKLCVLLPVCTVGVMITSCTETYGTDTTGGIELSGTDSTGVALSETDLNEEGLSGAELIETESVETEVAENDVTILTSNLRDDGSKTELDTVMTEAGVSEARRNVFWEHVDQFNQCDGMVGLTDGYENVSVSNPEYDVYELQDIWEAAYPDFTGYDCRITAFSLMGDYITIEDTSSPDASALFIDEEALQEDDSALMAENDLDRFLTLFSIVAAEDSDDSTVQAEAVRRAWQARGISFDDSVPMSLITVFLHDKYSEIDNELMIGHAGVLFDCGNDGLYFVEKLAFQAPYRVTKFSDRVELKEYLKSMYDVEWNQTTARPFILENGELL